MGLFRKKKAFKEEINKISNSEKETLIIKKENKRLWSTIGLAASIILIIFIISCVLNIYKITSDINKYFGIVSVVVICLLIIIFIFIPIIRVINAPSFTLDATKKKEKLTKKNYRTLKNVAKNIIKGQNSVPVDAKNKLMDAMNNRYRLRDELKIVYDKYIKKDISKLIWAHSSKVALSTGLSKNNTFDAFTTIISNIRMIMQIVVKCGYRPSYIKLAKLIFKVFRNALIAYSIESMNLGEIVVNSCSKFFKDIPAIGKPIASIMEGAANGFLTARIGVITRKYLYSEFDSQSKLLSIEEAEGNIAKEAVLEAKNIIDENGDV